jgi:stage V sporulation protein SpoVS
MNSLLVALVATGIGLGIPLAFLWARKPLLRLKSQAYRFHELRDRLQLLNIQNKIDNTSPGYNFLMFSLNLAIRNAGTMSLSDVLKISRAVKERAEGNGFEEIAEDIRRQGEEAQKLSAEFFQALAVMLISNDSLTSIMFTVAKPLAGVLSKAAFSLVAAIGRTLVPQQTEAVREAREYLHWGNVLAPSY